MVQRVLTQIITSLLLITNYYFLFHDTYYILSMILKTSENMVALNGPISSWASIEAGIPQGSILESISFLI